jgi:hypothetical protein
VESAEQAFAALSLGRTVGENTVLVEGSVDPLPAAPGLAQPLAAVRHGPNRVTVEVSQSRAGVLVLRESADPGWRARVDGLPTRVVTADGMFLGVPLKPGTHRVEFDYRPLGWRLGLALCALGAASLLAFTLLVARRRPAAGGKAVVSSPHGVTPENRSGC